ncbi:protochlorophyllide oxidoreductase [Nodularia spumigena CS-584]|nr:MULTISPECIES: hypothetical protein [Cyanophyceae]EAW43985.1 protochlorophyllide oxidoreductase [Nodularia spumigena CCY9414]MDB9317165.1 protochlorophyllide oxidoreductase [Nodularia spumigena CS-590/01A]MEA5607236.1 protochlorophyllide oxidoreductase [Nodularia spumigena UHCC 0060]KZL47837.1 protochlorophyllide oxidoreductase [Nodularia spumigena CENA596]MDB9304927.1 protochlorophyllide oxidoreductase [Nodularia spumigena CS-591/12]
MTSSEIKAGSKVVMTHAERQAFMKTSPLGQLFGVSHLLPEVEDLTSSNHASTDKATVVNTLSDNEQTFNYEMLEPCTRGRGKWLKKPLSWRQLYLQFSS